MVKRASERERPTSTWNYMYACIGECTAAFEAAILTLTSIKKKSVENFEKCTNTCNIADISIRFIAVQLTHIVACKWESF